VTERCSGTVLAAGSRMRSLDFPGGLVYIIGMRKLLPVLFSVFFVFVALAETNHSHEQDCDSPCPAVCLGSACGMYCDDSGSVGVAGPEDTVEKTAPDSASIFVARLSDDEIFHPPLV